MGPLYQWTTVSLEADGLDASPLATFGVQDTSVAVLTRHGYTLRGLREGSTLVYVVGDGTTSASATAVVTNAPVQVTTFVSKLVTSVEWFSSLPASFVRADLVLAQVLMGHYLAKEGDEGRIHAIATFSDGASAPVPHLHAPGLDELSVTSLFPNDLEAVPPSANRSFWRARVPRSALYHVGEMLYTEWKVCGVAQATAVEWASVEVPKPVSMSVSPSEIMLAPPNMAGLDVLGISSALNFTTRITFDDGTTRDYTGDPRLNHSVVEYECATIEGGRLLVGERGDECHFINVTHTFDAGPSGYDKRLVGLDITPTRFVLSTSIPVVSIDTFELTFVAQPDTHSTVRVTRLGPIQCTNPTQYHTAKPRAIINLFNDPTAREYDVTFATEFGSLDESVVQYGFGVLRARATSGVANITAVFEGIHGTNATLYVTSELDMRVTSINISSEALDAQQTLVGERGSMFITTVGLGFDSGLYVPRLAGGGGMSISSMLSLEAMPPTAFAVDVYGRISLLNNTHVPVLMSASLKCQASTAGVMPFHINLAPGEGDLDLGQTSGAQFQQFGSMLAVRVRLRLKPGHRLINFQVAADFDPSVLTSGTNVNATPPGNASFADGDWAGVEPTLNDPPGSFQLVGSNPDAQQTGVILLGTVDLNVVGSGVTLVSGWIIELVTISADGFEERVSDAAAIAGTGYAAVTDGGASGGRRLRELRELRAYASGENGGADGWLPQSQLAPSEPGGYHGPRWAGRRLQATAAACTPCSDANSSSPAIYGDLSGDCRFTSYDVLVSQRLSVTYQAFLAGGLPTNPLDTFPCDFAREQANPTQDLVGGDARIEPRDARQHASTPARQHASTPSPG